MPTYLGKSCSFGLPRVFFVNCRQFMYLVISLFGFEGRMWDLIVSVPDHCLSFYFTFHRIGVRCILVWAQEGSICPPYVKIQIFYAFSTFSYCFGYFSFSFPFSYAESNKNVVGNSHSLIRAHVGSICLPNDIIHIFYVFF